MVVKMADESNCSVCNGNHYVAKVKPGRVLYEISGIETALAKEALMLAAAKLPLKTKLLVKETDQWA